MSRVWETRCETHTQKLVLLALADNANDEGECWPSIQTIYHKCNLTERAVCYELKRLSKNGWIKASKRTDSKTGARKSNRYRIDLSKLPLNPVQRPPLNKVQTLSERNSETPLNILHPEPSDKPSVNQGKAPKKFVSELNAQIKLANEQIQSLRDNYTNGDGGWVSEPMRLECQELCRKRKAWKNEMMNL